jgi:hypothetical protein
MKMNVKNALPRIGTGIDDQAKTALREPIVAGQFLSDGKNLADQLLIAFFEIQNGSDVPSGNDQNMDRRLRIDVPERNHRTVLVYDVSLNFSVDDAAKKTRIHL